MKRKQIIENKSKKFIPLTLALAALVLTASLVSSFEFIKPAMAAELSNVRVLPSTNIVNERANYDFFFTTATTGTIQFIAIIMPPTGIADTPRLIERSGIGPGFLTTISGAQGLIHVYVVNNPVSIPAGTEIRLEMGTITNPNTVDDFQVTVATLNTNAAIIDANLSPPFTIKDIRTGDIEDNSITGNDVSPNLMIRKTLKDNAAGNAKGWNPNGALTTFLISDNDIKLPLDSTFVSVMLRNINPPSSGGPQVTCQVVETGISLVTGGSFRVNCAVAPEEAAELHYEISNLPLHVITSSLSSSSESTSPFASSQDTGSINTQDEYSSEFP